MNDGPYGSRAELLLIQPMREVGLPIAVFATQRHRRGVIHDGTSNALPSMVVQGGPSGLYGELDSLNL